MVDVCDDRDVTYVISRYVHGRVRLAAYARGPKACARAEAN